MAAGGGCINHPGVEAVARCKMCAKGLCHACRVIGVTGIFCSEGCKTKHEAFVSRAQSLERKGGGSSLFFQRLRNMIGSVVVLATVIFLAGLAGNLSGFFIPFAGPFAAWVTGFIGL